MVSSLVNSPTSIIHGRISKEYADPTGKEDSLTPINYVHFSICHIVIYLCHHLFSTPKSLPQYFIFLVKLPRLQHSQRPLQRKVKHPQICLYNSFPQKPP